MSIESTPSLTDAFADAMADLESAMDLLDRYGPQYVRDCIRHSTTRGGGLGQLHQPNLPPPLRRLVREIADDAVVRHLETGT